MTIIEEKKAKKAIEKDYFSRKRELDRVQKAAEQRRYEFVLGLEPSKAEPYLGPLAVWYARWGNYDSLCNEKQFEQLIDLDTLLTEDLMHNTYCATPAFLLLSLIVSSGSKSTYHFVDSLNRKIAYKGSNMLAMPAELEDLYRILIALGYEQTEEEKQWRDGTHFAYDYSCNNPN